jgi:26S proteasome non-ATPase regulatory subunit 10
MSVWKRLFGVKESPKPATPKTIDTRIHDAAKSGDLEKVKTLLKANPDLVSSKDDEGRTPLHSAAANGQKDVAELLLASKADVDAKNNSGCTPLHYAVGHGHEDVAELLRQHGGQE